MLKGIVIFWLWPPTNPEGKQLGFGVGRGAVLMTTTVLVILLILTTLALSTSFPAQPAAVLAAFIPVVSLILVNRSGSSYRYYQVDEQLRVVKILGRQRPAELGDATAQWVGFRGQQLLPGKFRKGHS